MASNDDDELMQLREEHRKRLASDISQLNSTMQQVQRDVLSMRGDFANKTELAAMAAGHEAKIAGLNARLAVLEEGKAKIIGGFIALSSLQVLSGILVWLVQHSSTK